MKHYILTKYNFGIYDKDYAEKWMAHRKVLFDKYTYPSVMNQTNKNFEWLVFFDNRTPNEVYAGYSFTPVLVPPLKYAPCRQYIKKNCSDRWIITTRLDNDDFIEPTFISNIHRVYNGNPKEGLTVDTWGIKYYHLSGVTKPAPSFPLSPFVSLLEKSDDLKTIKHRHHRNIHEKHPFVVIPKILYRQIIHDWNITNY